MNKNNYKSGKIRTGQNPKSRYAGSKIKNDNTKLIIINIALIVLLLAIVTLLFAVLSPDGLLAWNPFDDSSNTNTTPSTIQKPTDPNKDYPYGTTPDGNKFVADKGGEWLSGLDSKNAILVRLSDMTTIGYKGADESIYPASMTKLMTVIVALDLIENLDDVYTYKPDVFDRVITDVEQRQDLKYNASTSDMQYIYTEYYGDDEFGDCVSYTVRDLIYGISYRSGADSVVCLIDYLGLTWDQFVALMNSKANEIGLQNTHFGGAIGMDYENNQTTCRDMAAIMAYAMENPLCEEFFGGVSYRLTYIKMTYRNRTLYETLNNMKTTQEKVLWGDYTIVATKSGLEEEAGYCLVSCIKNNNTGEYFVLVTAGASKGTYPAYSANPIYDMQKIFENFAP